MPSGFAATGLDSRRSSEDQPAQGSSDGRSPPRASSRLQGDSGRDLTSSAYIVYITYVSEGRRIVPACPNRPLRRFIRAGGGGVAMAVAGGLPGGRRGAGQGRGRSRRRREPQEDRPTSRVYTALLCQLDGFVGAIRAAGGSGQGLVRPRRWPSRWSRRWGRVS